MYSRQQASQLKQEFWTRLGRYMNPVLSAEGEKINWINYKTGEKNIHFSMQADNKLAVVSILLTHKDPEIQQLFFEHFISLKKVFDEEVGEDWLWKLHDFDDQGRQVSRIYTELKGISIYQKQDWPALISFFKPRLIALDAFWSHVKYSFEPLR